MKKKVITLKSSYQELPHIMRRRSRLLATATVVCVVLIFCAVLALGATGIADPEAPALPRLVSVICLIVCSLAAWYMGKQTAYLSDPVKYYVREQHRKIQGYVKKGHLKAAQFEMQSLQSFIDQSIEETEEQR